jgi:hypothetical protein
MGRIICCSELMMYMHWKQHRYHKEHRNFNLRSSRSKRREHYVYVALSSPECGAKIIAKLTDPMKLWHSSNVKI